MVGTSGNSSSSRGWGGGGGGRGVSTVRFPGICRPSNGAALCCTLFRSYTNPTLMAAGWTQIVKRFIKPILELTFIFAYTMRFLILTAMSTQMVVFRVLSPCTLVALMIKAASQPSQTELYRLHSTTHKTAHLFFAYTVQPEKWQISFWKRG